MNGRAAKFGDFVLQGVDLLPNVRQCSTLGVYFGSERRHLRARGVDVVGDLVNAAIDERRLLLGQFRQARSQLLGGSLALFDTIGANANLAVVAIGALVEIVPIALLGVGATFQVVYRFGGAVALGAVFG